MVTLFFTETKVLIKLQSETLVSYKSLKPRFRPTAPFHWQMRENFFLNSAILLIDELTEVIWFDILVSAKHKVTQCINN